MSTKCKYDGCKMHQLESQDYCRKHGWAMECIAAGKRPCTRYMKGCKTQLNNDYALKTCEACLSKEREADNKKRAKVVVELNSNSNSNSVVERKCTTCCKVKPIEDFNGIRGGQTKTCKGCRDANKKADANRDKEHRRELDRIASQKEERKAVKQAWKEANPEKVAKLTLDYRDRQHNTNQEEYLKRNAEVMTQWRIENPEKLLESNKKRLINKQYIMKGYINKCQKYGHEFALTQEQFDLIIEEPCYYCGDKQEKGFNGIDRMDSTQGYVLENCVSCCINCNRLKCAVDNITFLQRVENILVYNKLIVGNLYPEAFSNHKHILYLEYKRRANNTNKLFEMTEDIFNDFTNKDCYMCGKQANENHKNGIDRFDNTIGYTINNIRPCCCQCNVMKKNFDFDFIISKFMQIYNNCNKKQQKEPSILISNSLNRNKNKMSKEERLERRRIQKQQQRQAMREKYGDEEFKRLHSEKIAEQRRLKKEREKENINV